MNQLIREASNAAGKRRFKINTSGATTSGVVTYTTQVPLPRRAPNRAKALENAVYGHIRAVRALGRTQISASEIAAALGLSVSAVMKALAGLRKKGVKTPE
jgi:hypothetical protein